MLSDWSDKFLSLIIFMYSPLFVRIIKSLRDTYRYPILLKIPAYSKPSSQIIKASPKTV